MRKKLLIALFIASILAPNFLYAALRDRLDTSSTENRTLAEFPELSLANTERFPAQFEEFYNDHMPFKNYFVRMNNFIDMRVFKKTSIGDVTIGADNWLFYTVKVDGENALGDYQHTNLYTQEQSEEIAAKMERTENYLQSQGVENFRIYIAPNKETIYPQYMPESIKVYGENGSRIERFAEYMAEFSAVDFNYLYGLLKPYSEQYQIYYKYDTHVNPLGSFLISQQISADFTGESLSAGDVTIEIHDTTSGDMARMINQESRLSDDPLYHVSNFWPEVTTELVDELTTYQNIMQEYRSDSGNDRTLLVVGDSYRLGVAPFLAAVYDHLVVYRIDDFTPEVLKTYQPDDVAVLLVERNQKFMENIDQYMGASPKEGSKE